MIKKKCVITAVITVIMAIFTICGADWINQTLMHKASRDRMQDLIEAQTNKDILFVGNSHVMDGVIPMDIWRDFGYTSYILCAEYNDMERYPAMLELALQYCSPSLVVIDVDNYWQKSEPEEVLMGYHEFADAFPLTKAKIQTTCELFEDEETRREIIFPFWLYHSRWNDLSKNDLKKSETSFYLKGYEFTTDTSMVEISQIIGSQEGELFKDAYGLEALKKVIQMCREQGIEVLLTTIPYIADVQEQEYLQGLHEFAREQQVGYVNLIEKEALVDESCDYREGGHLNLSGAQKVTAFLGGYIKDNYQVPVRSEEEKYRKNWEEARRDYLAYKSHQIREAEEEMEESGFKEGLTELLIQCSDHDMETMIGVRKESAYLEDAQMKALLLNIAGQEMDAGDFFSYGSRPFQEKLFADWSDGEFYFAIFESGNEEPICSYIF